MSCYKLICFDHDAKTWSELHTAFDLEEKRRIIEGYYETDMKIVQDVDINHRIIENSSKILKISVTESEVKACGKPKKVKKKFEVKK